MLWTATSFARSPMRLASFCSSHFRVGAMMTFLLGPTLPRGTARIATLLCRRTERDARDAGASQVVRSHAGAWDRALLGQTLLPARFELLRQHFPVVRLQHQ